MKNRKKKVCNRCGNIVNKSKVEGYAYTCNCCCEDLFTFEAHKKQKRK